MFSRRRFLALSAAGVASPALAQSVDLRLPGGPSERPLSNAFPGKRGMIVQRTTPPLLETPLSVFNGPLLTPNGRHYVRWHWPFTTEIDVAGWRLKVGGAVAKPLSLSVADLQKLPHHDVVAVNQCAGNARGLFEPRVPGAQWGNGAMSNARWTGVKLKDVLDRAGVRPGAVAVRFAGADTPPVEGAPGLEKSLTIDHARDGEVMIAWGMNGAPLPLLNGLPLRLIVPGWYATFRAKAARKLTWSWKAKKQNWTRAWWKLSATPSYILSVTLLTTASSPKSSAWPPASPPRARLCCAPSTRATL